MNDKKIIKPGHVPGTVGDVVMQQLMAQLGQAQQDLAAYRSANATLNARLGGTLQLMVAIITESDSEVRVSNATLAEMSKIKADLSTKEDKETDEQVLTLVLREDPPPPAGDGKPN